MAKIFQKIKKEKRKNLEPFWGQIWQKLIFLNKELCQFLNIPVIYNCAKNQIELMTYF